MRRFIRKLFGKTTTVRNAASTRLGLLRLEDRRVLSGVTATFNYDGDHILRVYGTGNVDNIVVRRQGGFTTVLDGGATVPIDAEAAGNLNTLPPGWLAGINVYGLGGGDAIEVRTVHINNFYYDAQNTGVPVYVHAGDGADTVLADNQTGVVNPQSLAYTINPATVNGGEGNDTVSGGSAADYLSGGTGADEVHAGLGHDTVYGGTEGDKLFGDGGDDRMYGGDNNDLLYGGTGNDRLFGNTGSDMLFGGDGDDWLEAGSASEAAEGGSGTNWNAHQWSSGGTDRADVKQGRAHTCSLMATLAAASHQGIDLTSKITYEGNYHYSVRMFDTVQNQWVSIGVDFDGTLLRDPDNKVVDPISTTGPNGVNEFWTVLYQRAYLDYFQGKDVTDVESVMSFASDPNCAKTVKNVLGGDASTEMMPWFAEDTRAKLDAGEVLTVGGTGHRYGVLEVVQDSSVAGGWKVKLFDPRHNEDDRDFAIDDAEKQDADGVFWVSWSNFTNPDYFKNYTFTR